MVHLHRLSASDRHGPLTRLDKAGRERSAFAPRRGRKRAVIPLEYFSLAAVEASLPLVRKWPAEADV